MKRLPSLVLATVCLSILAVEPAFAQADPFTSGVTWLQSGPARGIAMFGVAALAIALWFFAGSVRLAGMVLGGGLLMANADVIVSWMGL